MLLAATGSTIVYITKINSTASCKRRIRLCGSLCYRGYNCSGVLGPVGTFAQAEFHLTAKDAVRRILQGNIEITQMGIAAHKVFVNRCAGELLGDLICHQCVRRKNAVERTVCAAIASVDQVTHMLRLTDLALCANTDEGIQFTRNCTLQKFHTDGGHCAKFQLSEALSGHFPAGVLLIDDIMTVLGIIAEALRGLKTAGKLHTALGLGCNTGIDLCKGIKTRYAKGDLHLAKGQFYFFPLVFSIRLILNRKLRLHIGCICKIKAQIVLTEDLYIPLDKQLCADVTVYCAIYAEAHGLKVNAVKL